MTMQGMLGFVDKIHENGNLLGEIERFVDDESVENIASELVKLGSSNGFEFNESEALQMRDMLRGSLDGGELTDQQLEMVAGGMWPPGGHQHGMRVISRYLGKREDFLSGW